MWFVHRFGQIAYCLLDEHPPGKMIYDWFYNEGEELQDFFGVHAKVQWTTAIDTIEAIEHMIEGAVGNANLTVDYAVEFPVSGSAYEVSYDQPKP